MTERGRPRDLEKRALVRRLLTSPLTRGEPTNRIANLAGVSHKLVRTVAAELQFPEAGWWRAVDAQGGAKLHVELVKVGGRTQLRIGVGREARLFDQESLLKFMRAIDTAAQGVGAER